MEWSGCMAPLWSEPNDSWLPAQKHNCLGWHNCGLVCPDKLQYDCDLVSLLLPFLPSKIVIIFSIVVIIFKISLDC